MIPRGQGSSSSVFPLIFNKTMLKNVKKISGKTLISIGAYVLLKWTIIIFLGSYLHRNGYWHNSYFLFLPVFAGIVFYVRKKRKARQPS